MTHDENHIKILIKDYFMCVHSCCSVKPKGRIVIATHLKSKQLLYLGLTRQTCCTYGCTDINFTHIYFDMLKSFNLVNFNLEDCFYFNILCFKQNRRNSPLPCCSNNRFIAYLLFHCTQRVSVFYDEYFTGHVINSWVCLLR